MNTLAGVVTCACGYVADSIEDFDAHLIQTARTGEYGHYRGLTAPREEALMRTDPHPEELDEDDDDTDDTSGNSDNGVYTGDPA